MQIKDIFRLREVAGLIGVEVEVEGHRLPDAPDDWNREHDGSLRGEENAEYVFERPLTRPQAFSALNKLARAYKDSETQVDDSLRTSIHVHLNVQDFTMTQVMNLFTLYAAAESVLMDFCGEGRKGNLFCLRLRDAEQMVALLSGVARNKAWRHLRGDDLRYAAFNFNALGKFGSIEFRCMRGTDDFGIVKQWIDMLLALYVKAKEYETPKEIVEQVSIQGPVNFVEGLFAGLGAAGLVYDEREILENLRIVQDLAYCRDWGDV